MTERETWLAERRKGVGGSDVASVLNERPWGCSRRLVYDKRGVEPDFPIDDKLVFQRGRVLEDAAADRYEIETGRTVVRSPTIEHPGKPWRRVNIDREVIVADVDDKREFGPGILEIKTANASEFARLKRDGMRAAYILQLQWALGVTGRKWGSFAVLHPDSWRLLWWDVWRDDNIIAQLFEAVDAFWPLVENGPLPAQLDHRDDRCQRCPWRITCHGTLAPLLEPKERGDLEEDESISAALADYREAKELADAVFETMEMAKDRLREALNGKTAVSCHGAKVYHRPQIQNRVSTEMLKKKYPEVAKECTVQTEMQALRVYFPTETGE